MNQILKNHNLYTPRPGHSEVKDDFHTVEWGREANAGFVIGKTSFPVFFTADGHNVHLQDSARGASIMIVTPNASPNDAYGKAHTWGIAEACSFCKPSIMTVFQNPNDFNIKQWFNPAIMKIVPLRLARIYRTDRRLVSHSPSTFYFRRHRSCSAVDFTNEETIWHNDDPLNNIFAVVQLAVIMGYRQIFINKLDWPKTGTSTTNQIDSCVKLINNTDIKLFNCGSKAGEIPCISTNKAFQQVFYDK